jgi:hypothetical protein
LLARPFRGLPIIPILALLALGVQAADMLLIDDFQDNGGLTRLGTPWRLVTDRVMGGVSAGRMSREEIDGRRALCMRGDVSLDNNGGFIQLNLDLNPLGYLDASRYTGIQVVVRGNGASYNLHLKTADVRLPWQSYRSSFQTGPEWREIRLPFQSFEPHRIGVPLDTVRLDRLGLVAIGRAFTAELCVAQVGLYRDPPVP